METIPGDPTKLLYITPPWRAVRSINQKPSFIKVKVVFENAISWDICLSRDCMGLGWITNELPPDYDMSIVKNVKFKIPDYTFNKDQLLRNWLVINLSIRSRKTRMLLVFQLIEKAIGWFIQNPSLRNICIPRMIVFKESDKLLSYSYEMISGDSTLDVAKSIGCESILNVTLYTNKGLLKSPISTAGGFRAPEKIKGGGFRSPPDEDEEDDENEFIQAESDDDGTFGSSNGFRPCGGILDQPRKNSPPDGRFSPLNGGFTNTRQSINDLNPLNF